MKAGFNFDAIKSAANAAWQTATSTAKDLSKAVAQEVVGAKCLLDYTLQGQVASGGPGCLWKIYLARAKKEGAPYPLVSAWILDKRTLQGDQHGSSSGRGHSVTTRPSVKRLEAFLEQCRKDVQHLARLKHPSVVRLVSPLEETRTQLVFISEPIFSSLEDVLHGGHGLHAELAQERRELKLSELEIKHGLLQVCDGLHFLHSEAGMVHRAVCPENIYITHSGSWKLAGLSHAASLDYSQGGLKPFDYSDSAPSLLVQVTQPPLPYTAPELVAAGPSTVITSSADVFSLATVCYEALTRKQLLPVGFSLAEYESRVASITMMDLAGCPLGLEQVLRQMLAPAPSARPPVVAFAGSQYFQGDVLLRGLKFLDTLLQRDALQKAAFLKDLPTLCAQFDTRVLKLKVLPPLLQELRSEELQPLLLPIVLRLVECQEGPEFEDSTLPALRPLLTSARGEALLLLTQQAGLLARVAPKAAAATLVPQLLVRAAEHGDVRCQEEMLRQVGALAEALDYEGLKAQVLPAVQVLCLNTTAAAVRVGAFAAMGKLVVRMDQAEAAGMLGIMAQVTAVDKTPATTMCALALGENLAKQWGPRLTAERVLPVLCPLLVVPSLNSHQFAAAMKTVRELLARVERARGVDGSGSNSPSLNQGARHPDSSLTPGVEAAPQPADWLAATSTLPPSYPHSPHTGRRPAPVPLARSGSGAGSGKFPPGPSIVGTGQGVWGSSGPAGAAAAANVVSQPYQQQPAWQGDGVSDVLAGMTLQPRSPAANGPAAQPGSNNTGGSLSGDPFAWPPPAPRQQEPAQAAMGGSMRGAVAPKSSGASMGGSAAMRSSGGMGSSVSGGDPFAGLQLALQAGSAAGAAAVAPGGGADLDPFDSLVMSENRQSQQRQRPPPGSFL